MRSPNFLADRFFDLGQRRCYLRFKFDGILLFVVVKIGADFGGNW